jgi:hypothetical protein
MTLLLADETLGKLEAAWKKQEGKRAGPSQR